MIAIRSKPILIYDGNCAFCKRWVHRVKSRTQDRVEYGSSQEMGDYFPKISIDQFQKSIWLIDTDGKIYSAAGAAFRVLSYAHISGLLFLYQHFKIFRIFSEWIYKVVANNRSIISKLELFLLGPPSEKDIPE